MRDSEIRVGTSGKYRSLYKDLKESAVIGDAHELFFICTCLGYINNKRKALEKKDDRFRTYNLTGNEWTSYFAMTLRANKMIWQSIIDEKKMFETIEEYSNAGMEILLQEFLDQYVSCTGEEPRLIANNNDGLPIKLLTYLFSECQN